MLSVGFSELENECLGAENLGLGFEILKLVPRVLGLLGVWFMILGFIKMLRAKLFRGMKLI